MVTRRSSASAGANAMSTGRRVIIVGLRVVAGLVFCYAGWIKIRSPQPFADSVAAFQLLPAPLINLLALGLPPYELAVGLLLLSGWKPRLAALCALVACTIFLLALLSAALRGLPVDCGCFGGTPSNLPPPQRLWLDVGRDLLLLAAVAFIYRDACSQKQIS